MNLFREMIEQQHFSEAEGKPDAALRSTVLGFLMPKEWPLDI